jgi:putative SOS response-associated peptidase YedK
MCNLYSITKGQQAIRDLAGAMRDLTGNLPMLPGVFPDYSAPIVRTAGDGARELAMARWGMPSPAFAIAGKKTDPCVTNIRNVKSSHWRRWLGVESRCIVPFTSFAENEVLPDGSRPPVWFAFDDSRPLAFFAGIWTRWTSVRKVRKGETTNDLFGFLTTEPNATVGAAHAKAMPFGARGFRGSDAKTPLPQSFLQREDIAPAGRMNLKAQLTRGAQTAERERFDEELGGTVLDRSAPCVLGQTRGHEYERSVCRGRGGAHSSQ